MSWRRRRTSAPAAATVRRSGSVGEEPWWEPRDQAALEALDVPRRILGRGWIPVPMLNNVEPVHPYGPGEAGEALGEARRARTLTALDGGRAWRRREGQVLAVLRLERFADEAAEAADAAAVHRRRWQDRGAAALEDTWRANWIARGAAPGWIEARPVAPEERPDPLHVFSAADAPAGPAGAVDWFQVEDHTGGPEVVVLYQHVTIWRGRQTATLTVRHDLGLDLDQEVATAAAALHERLGDGAG